MQYKKLSLILLTGISLGSSIVFARFALQEVNPFTIAVLRFGIASFAFLLTLIVYKKSMRLDAVLFRDLMIVGIFATGLPIFLFYFALTYISSGMFTIFLSSLPLFTALLAHVFLKGEKLNTYLTAGLFIAFVGVILIIATKSTGIAGGEYTINGPLLTFVGVLSWAFGSVYAKSHLQHIDVLVVSCAQTVAAFVFITLLVLVMGKFHLGPMSFLGWFSIFYNALVGSYIAFWLVFTLIKNYGATASALPNYVMPVVSTLLGAVFLGEIITPALLVGASIILIGVYFSTKIAHSRELA